MAKRLTRMTLALVSLALFIGGLVAMRGWAENWGSTAAERGRTLAGDELIPPGSTRSTMAMTINAPAQRIWPWLAQFGAGRGGLYTYAWFEGLLNCPVTNADRILPNVQALRPGDTVRLCPGDFGPPPFTVATVMEGQALILGTRDTTNATWESTWQFVLVPVDSQSTRLLLRSGTSEPTAFDTLLGPGFFVMQRHMLQGFQERAEGVISPWYARDVELAFWLISFIGFLVSMVAIGFSRQPLYTFLDALFAAAVTLALIFIQPPVWMDVLGALSVWVGIIQIRRVVNTAQQLPKPAIGASAG